MSEVANRGPFAGGPQHKAEEGSFLLRLLRVLSGHPWIALLCQVIEGQVCVGLGLAFMQQCQMLLAEV